MSSKPSTKDWEWSAFDVYEGRIKVTNWKAFDPEIALMTVRVIHDWNILIDTPDMTVAWNAHFAGQDAFRLLFIRRVR